MAQVGATQLVDTTRAQLEPLDRALREHAYLEAAAERRLDDEDLRAFVGEQYAIIQSDELSFNHLAVRYADTAAGGFFLDLAKGEAVALAHLETLAVAIVKDRAGLDTYEPMAGAQAYNKSWHEHVDYWLGDRRTAPTLLVRYEDMERDAAGQLRAMVDFMDWTVDDSSVQAAVDSSRIDRMRSKEQGGEFLAHVGRGGSGHWRDRYSDEELALFLADSAPTLRRYGYLSED